MNDNKYMKLVLKNVFYVFSVLTFSCFLGTSQAKAQLTSDTCYSYTPSLEPTFSVNLVTSNGQRQTVILPKQELPSILQRIDFVTSNITCALPSYTYFRGLNNFVMTGGPEIPFTGNPYLPDLFDYNSLPGAIRTNFYSGLGDLGLGVKANQTVINNEDAVINSIASTKRFSMKMSTEFGSAIASAPATNCVQLSGKGPKKIVFMRGKIWNSSVSDFIELSGNVINNGFKVTDPFKTYINQFSFYVDLQKVDRKGFESISSSCGTDAFEYVYFTNDISGDKRSYAAGNVANIFVNSFTSFAPANPSVAGPAITMHESGHTIGRLQDEYRESKNEDSFFQLLSGILNCSVNPYEDYRTSVDNKIYGAVDVTGCRYPKNNLGEYWHKPSKDGLMSFSGELIFNVIDCGYLVSAINGEPINVEHAATHWPECMKLDVNKEGIPPVVPAPKLNNIWHPVEIVGSSDESTGSNDMAITIGSDLEVTGSGFTDKGNAIQLKAISGANKDKIYDFPGIPGIDNRTRIWLTIPNDIPVGDYNIKVGALNSDWSSYPYTRTIHGAAPSNLIASVVNAGRIDLSWTDNSSDEEDFVILRFSGDDLAVAKAIKEIEKTIFGPNIGKIPTLHNTIIGNVDVMVASVEKDVTTYIDKAALSSTQKYTYMVKARHKESYLKSSVSSNIVTAMTLSKPLAPILFAFATSDNRILLSWSDTNEGVDYVIFPSPPESNNGLPIAENLVTRHYVVANLEAEKEYCYTVAAVIENVFSDPSNIACATTNNIDDDEGFLDIPSSKISGNQNIAFIPNTSDGTAGESSISSIDLNVDGTIVGSDSSAPWNLSFNSNQFTNGSHNAFVIIHYSSPKPPVATAPKPIIINNPISVTNVTSGSAERTFVVTGTGFTEAGNIVKLTHSVSSNTYEVKNLPSSGKVITFTVPSTVPSGRYRVSVINSSGNKRDTTFIVTLMNTISAGTVAPVVPSTVDKIPHYTCSSDYQLALDNVCYKAQTTVNTPASTVSASVKYYCTDGSKPYSFGGKMRCTQSREASAEYYCPLGKYVQYRNGTFDLCDIPASSVVTPASTKQPTVTYTCPEGYKLSDNSENCISLTPAVLKSELPPSNTSGVDKKTSATQGLFSRFLTGVQDLLYDTVDSVSSFVSGKKATPSLSPFPSPTTRTSPIISPRSTLPPTPTTTPRPSVIITPRLTPLPSSNFTPLPSPIHTVTPIPSATMVSTPTPTPFVTPTIVSTPTPTPVPTPVLTPTPTPYYSFSTPTPTPVIISTPTPTPTPTSTLTPVPTPTPTPSSTPQATATPTPSLTPSPTASPLAQAGRSSVASIFEIFGRIIDLLFSK